MADVQALRAFRYDLGRVGALSDVVAPPYDVIDSTLQEELYDRSPYNVIRLILNKESPTDTENDNRYTRSARTLKDWQQGGILAQDSARRYMSIIKISRSKGVATRARVSWPASAWRNLGRAAFIPTKRRSPDPRPIA